MLYLPLAVLGIDDFVVFVAVSLVIAAATTVLSELLRPKPKIENARPAGLGEFKFPTATEGRVIPLIWGTVKLEGPNVVWYGDFRQEAITQKIKTGMWSSKRITKGYTYFIGMQMALCRGPVDALRRIWVGDDVVYNMVVPGSGSVHISQRDLFGGDEFGNGGVLGDGHFYHGAPDAAVPVPGDYLYDFQNPRLPYRGTCHFVWEGGYIGNSTSLLPWKFEVSRFPNGLAVPDGKHIVNTYDANPACVLYEILTNSEWGFGFPASYIDAAMFRTVAATLHAEGNGVSLILDQAKEATELLNEIQRQIDGVLYLDHIDEKFKLKLARGGYDILTIPQLDASNVLEVGEFTRGTWDETSNQVRIQFSDRAKDYQGSTVPASDLANQRIQGGTVIPATLSFPTVKSRDLATNLAARHLKYLSTPLARASVVVDRSMWQIRPGDVVAWTDTNLGFVRLPMRVGKADFGDLADGKITLSLTQDIFAFATSFDGTPEDTLWTPPTQAVQALPAGQQLAIEAPYAICRRDPETPSAVDRIFAAGRNQGRGEISLALYERHSGGVPAGAYAAAGEVMDFMVIGAVRTAVGAADTTIDVDPTPDTVARILDEFTVGPTAADIGQNLVNLIMVGDEFVGVATTSNQTSFVRTSNVYRGLLDSTPKPHAAGEPVYMIFAGAGLTDTIIPSGQNVHLQIRPKSRDAETAEGDAIAISLTMADRCRRPYPATALQVNASSYPATSSIDTMKAGGTTDDDRGITVVFRRRDYRNFDEVQSIGADAAAIIADFPAANTTEENAILIIDPDGAPSTVETKAWAAVTTFFFSRTKLLRASGGARPARLRTTVGTRHTFQGTVYEGREDLGHSFNTAASEIDGWTAMGVLTTGQIGAAYTAPTTGSYAFSIGPNLPGGNIEARLNGGAWGVVVSGGARTGSLAVTAGDTIEIRCTYAGPGTGETFLKVDAPGSGSDAYAILVL